MARSSDPYLDGLKMLSRRELSEAQVRERLARRGHDPAAIDEAVVKLRAERAIDDVRAAESIVRTEVSVRRRGSARARLALERAGIADTTARRAVDDAFEGTSEDARIEAILARRLHGSDVIADDRGYQRLYRYLVSQGFDPDRVVAALEARKRHT